MKKNNNNFVWIKNQLDGKGGYLAFLLIIVGVVISSFSIYETNSLYENVNIILHNNFFLIFLFISNGLCITKITKDVIGNTNYIIRIGNTSNIIKDVQKKIFIASVIIFLMAIILVTTASVFLSFNGVNIFCDKFYFLFLGNIYNYISIFMFLHLTNLIMSYLTIIFNYNTVKYIILFYFLFIIFSFTLCPRFIVMEFSNIPFIFTWCLSSNVLYKTCALDLFCTSANLCIVSIIYIIMLELEKKYNWRSI